MLESGAGILQGVEGQRRLVLREAVTVGEFIDRASRASSKRVLGSRA